MRKLSGSYHCSNSHRIEQLIHHINRHHPVSANAAEAIKTAFVQQVYSRGDLLVSEGTVCRHLYFMEKGAIRGYFLQDGKEVTYWFAFENDFLTSFHSFITRRAAVENIQFMEGSIVWVISKEKLDQLLFHFPELEKLLRIIYEQYYIRLEERFVNAQFSTATERYNDLLVQSPHIAARVPLGYIASYLGISQETLSRIRARL